VTGEVEVDEALSKERLSSGSSGGGTGALARYAPPPGSGADTSFPKFMLDIGVKAPGGVLIRNDLFDVDMAADIHVINSIESPRIIGTARVLKGNMLFRERVFQIQSAGVDFDNPTVMDPKLTLAGYTDVSGTRVNLGVAGRLSAYKVDLTSNPVLPEPEILSLLALGFTSGDMQRLKTGDRSSIEQSEAASLVLHSTDFNRDLESKTGLRIQIDESVASDVGSSIFRPRSETEVGTAPKIVVKRQLGKRVDVSVGSTVGVGTNSQQEVNAEFKVSPSVSVIGVWDTNEDVNSQQSRTTSYGVDLKVQKRFK
jgi:translocation and assembly module TamB